MKKTLFVIAFTFLFGGLMLSSPFEAQATEGPETVTIVKVKGDVEVVPAMRTQATPAKPGQSLAPDAEIRTGPDASAQIRIGETGEIWLQEETTWSYSDFRANADDVEFTSSLALGELKAKVRDLSEDSLFEIQTPTSVVAVRGTLFNLLVYLFQQRYFTLLEVMDGIVQFSNLTGSESYRIREGYQATSNDRGAITPPQPEGGTTERFFGQETPSADFEENSTFQPPRTFEESQPGQSRFKQETQGSQRTASGADPGAGGGSINAIDPEDTNQKL